MTVYCFSGSGHSLAVAKALAGMLDCDVRLIGAAGEAAEDPVAVVFPVYCQNIPQPVKRFLKKLEAKQVALIATYGKISYGNVLYEAQKHLRGEVIVGACIPIGHTFLDGDYAFQTDFLIPVVERIKAPQTAVIPRSRKNPLADILPAFRSRMGVKLIKTERCSGCGLCRRNCPMGTIRSGGIHGKCIRCLRCVTSCPQKALRYKNRWVLDQYLKRYRKEEYVLYL